MNHQQQQEDSFPKVNFLKFFPFNIFPKMRVAQKHTYQVLSESANSMVFEEPTGTGKTAIGYGFLKGQQSLLDGPCFYLTTTKTEVDQIKQQFPDFKVAYGRGEYPCLYYGETGVTAQESPCYMLKCKHRVNQDSGDTEEPGATPCPYYQAKFEAKKGGLVAATASFFLYTYFFSKEWKQKPAGIVLDEIHSLADIFRHTLSFDISDYHLSRSIELLQDIDPLVALQLEKFKKRMIYFVKKRSHPNTNLLLKETEISELITILSEINGKDLIKKVRESVKVDEVDRETLKRLQDIVYGVSRYIRSLKYTIPSVNPKRKPLSYMYGYVREDMNENDRVKYKLCIKSYFVAGMIRSMLEGIRTLSYSATIGNIDILRHESGVPGDFEAVGSDFQAKNTRIFLPTDVADLSHKNAKKQDKTKTLRRIARTAKRFADKGLRSLVVVVSDAEREKFMMLAEEEKLHVLTYSTEATSRQVLQAFKDGLGDSLLGTMANYGQGIDLPGGMAPITFVLRPDYPHPNDPMTQFEEDRFPGGQRWAIWTWRVIIKALQVRGRNVRSAEDKGVTFFMSNQYRRFLMGSLPLWLHSAYRGQITFDEAVKEAEELLL